MTYLLEFVNSLVELCNINGATSIFLLNIIICFVSGEGLSASRHSLRAGLSASNISLRGENRLSLLLNYLLPGTPAASRSATPLPTPQCTPPSSPRCGHKGPTNVQPSELQCPALLVSPANDDIPKVIIHPPEEDLEAQESKKTSEDISDVTPGNYFNSNCPCVVLSAAESLALQSLSHSLSNHDLYTSVCMFCFFICGIFMENFYSVF